MTQYASWKIRRFYQTVFLMALIIVSDFDIRISNLLLQRRLKINLPNMCQEKTENDYLSTCRH
jgi:hypothetical protein